MANLCNSINIVCWKYIGYFETGYYVFYLLSGDACFSH